MGAAEVNIVRKYIRVDATKLKRLQTLYGVKTESETVELALDMVIAEYERNRLIEDAHREFLASGLVIRDVHGNLG